MEVIETINKVLSKISTVRGLNVWNRSADTTSNPFLPCESRYLSLAVEVLLHLHFCNTLCQVLRTLLMWIITLTLAGWLLWAKWTESGSLPAQKLIVSHCIWTSVSLIFQGTLFQLPKMEYLKPMCIVTWRPTVRQSWGLLHHDGYPRKCSMLRKGQRFPDFCCGLSFKICFLFQGECFLRKLLVTYLFMLVKWKSRGMLPFLLWWATQCLI